IARREASDVTGALEDLPALVAELGQSVRGAETGRAGAQDDDLIGHARSATAGAVQAAPAVDIETEAVSDTAEKALQVRALTEPSAASGSLPHRPGELLGHAEDEEPEGVEVTGAHVLGVERAVAETVVAKERGPVLVLPTSVVGQLDFRAEK